MPASMRASKRRDVYPLSYHQADPFNSRQQGRRVHAGVQHSKMGRGGCPDTLSVQTDQETSSCLERSFHVLRAQTFCAPSMVPCD